MISATGSSRPVCVTVPIEPRCCSASLFPSAVRASAADGKVLPVVETDGPAGDDPLSAPHRRAGPELQRPQSAKAFSRPAPGCPGRAAAKKITHADAFAPLGTFSLLTSSRPERFHEIPTVSEAPRGFTFRPFPQTWGQGRFFLPTGEKGHMEKTAHKKLLQGRRPFRRSFFMVSQPSRTGGEGIKNGPGGHRFPGGQNTRPLRPPQCAHVFLQRADGADAVDGHH